MIIEYKGNNITLDKTKMFRFDKFRKLFKKEGKSNISFDFRFSMSRDWLDNYEFWKLDEDSPYKVFFMYGRKVYAIETPDWEEFHTEEMGYESYVRDVKLKRCKIIKRD